MKLTDLTQIQSYLEQVITLIHGPSVLVHSFFLNSIFFFHVSFSLPEYGMALVNQNRNRDASKVLLKVHNKELSGNYFMKTIDNTKNNDLAEITSTENLLRTRFKLVTALSNSGACDEAKPLILEGLKWIDTISTTIGNMDKSEEVSSTENVNLDNKAYFLIAKSRCSDSVASMAAAAYEAVITRPQMQYALDHAKSVGKIVEKVNSSQLDSQKVMTSWELEEKDGQTAKLSFHLKH